MIYSITPNPALDLGGTVNHLEPNEKAYVLEEKRYPGGNAINAARILNRLKIPVLTSGFLGGGVGQDIETLLKRENLNHHFISIEGHTRINITISNRETKHQTRLSFSGPRIKQAEQETLIQWFKQKTDAQILMIGGSLPPGINPSWIRKLTQIAHQKKIPTVIDVPGPVLEKVISSCPFLIKPNLTEFQQLVGKKVTTINEVLRAARPLLSQVPLICVSSVENGALLISESWVYFGSIPKITIRSTVGAGDSMVGGLCAILWRQLQKLSSSVTLSTDKIDGEQALRLALAASTATLAHPGTTLGTASEIRRYSSQVKVKKFIN